MLNNFCLHIEFYVLNQAFSEAEKCVKCFHPSLSVIEHSIHTSQSCFFSIHLRDRNFALDLNCSSFLSKLCISE